MGGYGGSFAQWVHSDNPQPYYSFGNGSAMRVSPIGLYFDNEFGDVMNEAEKSAQITHDHPEGIKGAQVTALCMNAVPVSVSCVLNSTSFEEAIRNAMMIGGDSDTIGAITGGIAEAMYGIPEYMEDIALSYLTDEMKNVVTKFYNKL